LAVIPTEVKAIYSDFLELLNGKGDLLSWKGMKEIVWKR
jgi:hypothetical protein